MIIPKDTKFNKLRSSYPVFIYESFDYTHANGSLEVSYHFNLDNKYHFFPKLNFFLFNKTINDKLAVSLLENAIFNIGMIELISYWKAACSPEIIIRPFKLTDEQLSFWKKLYFNGLGEFFYTNRIELEEDSLYNFTFDSNAKYTPISSITNVDNSVIIPVGGGKDSVVSLEILNSLENKSIALVVNQRGATRAVLETAGFTKENFLEIERTIDPQLLDLNEKGFLNGHTPFSALLAFVSCLGAILTGKGNIALSNESSANEASIPGTKINHQYSKSFEFENDFRNYYKDFVTPSVNYYSLLRPLNELQIAKLFSRLNKYHSVFKSCNAGSKTDIWCCNCPKCIFTYIILSPFIKEQELISIFGENLFEKEEMKEYFEQLSGFANEKPFECVGTIDEVNAAIIQTISQHEGELPLLLKLYKNRIAKKAGSNNSYSKLISGFDSKNFIDSTIEEVLKSALGIIT